MQYRNALRTVTTIAAGTVMIIALAGTAQAGRTWSSPDGKNGDLPTVSSDAWHPTR